MRSPFLTLALASSLALLLSVAPAPAQENLANFAPKDGEVFPEMSFPTLDGDGFASLKDFRGKKVLLMQFASW